MGILRDLGFYSSYLGDQIDLLLAAMAQANPLPSGTNWVAFIDDCRAAQSGAEAAQAAAATSAAAASNSETAARSWAEGGTGTRIGESEDNAQYYSQQSAASAEASADSAAEAHGYAQQAAVHTDLPIVRGASGLNSVVIGDVGSGAALDTYAVTEGEHTTARGRASHAEGYYTVAAGMYQHVFGFSNIEDTGNKFIEIAGNGIITGHRSNARTLDWYGNEQLQGNLYVGADTSTATLDETRRVVTAAELSVLDTRVTAIETAQDTAQHYAKLHFGYAAPIGHIVLGAYGYATVAIQLPCPMEGTISSVTFSGHVASIGGITLDTTQISQKYISGSTLFLVYAATSGTAWSTGILTTDVANGINLEITTT